jgi:hypothetical protein
MEGARLRSARVVTSGKIATPITPAAARRGMFSPAVQPQNVFVFQGRYEPGVAACLIPSENHGVPHP